MVIVTQLHLVVKKYTGHCYIVSSIIAIGVDAIIAAITAILVISITAA